MTLEQFWTIISVPGGGHDGACDQQVDVVRQRLASLAPQEVASFQERFQEQMNRAYTWDLWGAAFIINGGCSDDGFEYFRAWLIMQGPETFERALAEPESLVEVVTEPPVECEDILYLPFGLFEEATGTSLPAGQPHPPEPSGTPWHEDDLDTRFPRLTEAFE